MWPSMEVIFELVCFVAAITLFGFFKTVLVSVEEAILDQLKLKKK